MQNQLDDIADWARRRIRAGEEPPWAYYKLMQLLDAIEGLREDCPITQRMGNSLRSEVPPDGDRPRRADRDGVIEMVFGCGARVRLRGEVSSETLRQVIELLR